LWMLVHSVLGLSAEVASAPKLPQHLLGTWNAPDSMYLFSRFEEANLPTFWNE
jgi:hypothetical protein